MREYKERNFSAIAEAVKQNAWYGGKHNAYILSEDGSTQLDISGKTYESGYEFFTTTVHICENGELLFTKGACSVESYHNETYVCGKFDTAQEALSYLEEKYSGVKFCDVTEPAKYVPLPTDERRWEREWEYWNPPNWDDE